MGISSCSSSVPGLGNATFISEDYEAKAHHGERENMCGFVNDR